MNGTATLTGQILGKPIEFKITFEIPPTSHFQMPIVHHLASKSLIHELQMGEDWSDAATTRKQKNRIVNLSLESGVVSLHTAYIALDEEQDKVVEGAVKTWDVFATMTLYKESRFPPSKRMPTTKSSTRTHTANPMSLPSDSSGISTFEMQHIPPREEGHAPDFHLTMPELLEFRARDRRINIPQQIDTNFYLLGFLLLEDSAGVIVHSIVHKHGGDAEKINIEILHQWLSGRGKKPVSWRTLIEVLRDVGLFCLASDIEEVLWSLNFAWV